MLGRKKIIISILLFMGLLSLVGCDVSKRVRDKEVKEFTNSLLKSNEKIKELDFYFRRPSLWGELVYDGDLDDGDLESLISEFKELIDIEFMQRIGDSYWGGSRPSGFYLNIYVDEKRGNDYDYQIASDYNKTYKEDEDPDNIDGYESWRVWPADSSDLIIDVGKSTKFTEEEIKDAIKIVKDNFAFPASTLRKLWYEEEESDKQASFYLESGRGSENGAKKEDVIVILSNFDVDDSGDNPVLNPGSTYENYNWILIRDNKSSRWEIDDSGY